ncbi:hypothetical protein MKW94_016359, partial [Papaver nudicaule]|nr:hypothetical protein [Papaver nudicaule]
TLDLCSFCGMSTSTKQFLERDLDVNVALALKVQTDSYLHELLIARNIFKFWLLCLCRYEGLD